MLLSRWLGEPLAGEDALAFAREVAAVNRRRLRLFGPLMILLHAVHVAIFWTSPARRPALAPDVLRWRDDLVAAHAIMVPLVLLMTWAVYRARSEGVVRLLGPFTAAVYLVHGAVCSSVDQIVVPSLTAYIGYCLGIAVIVCMPPRAALLVYAAGAATLGVGLTMLQRSADALLARLPNCGTLTVVGLALSWLLYAARRRDFAQRLTIDRQRDELARLNAGLEQRVREQVAEIIARAGEVEQLNAQLQAQIRARSSELELALALLAGQRPGGGALRRRTVLGGRFVIAEPIGAGGMGAVYAAVDESTGRRVAVKVVQAASAGQLDALRRFLREAGAAATVTHPAVVRMVHVGISDDGMLFQVQELVEGEVLARRIGHPWAAADAARLVAVLCDALAAAHAQGVVHRDVKPENIMLIPGAPGLKLLDFGIAKLRDAVLGAGERTSTGLILGTPAFMAPEQVHGDADVGDRADVYAAGVLLFRLLAWRLPFEGKTAREQMMGRLAASAPDVRSSVPSVPAALARVIRACLQREPRSRPSAEALARELGAWADAHGGGPLEMIVREPALPDDTPAAALAGTLPAGLRGL